MSRRGSGEGRHHRGMKRDARCVLFLSAPRYVYSRFSCLIQIIISDHNDPDRIEVIDSNPTPEKIASAESHPHKNVIHIPSNAIDAELARLKKESFTSPELREENAVKKAVLRRGSIAAATQAAATQAKAAVALMKPKDDGLTPAQREEKQRLKLEKDAWCRREKVRGGFPLVALGKRTELILFLTLACSTIHQKNLPVLVESGSRVTRSASSILISARRSLTRCECRSSSKATMRKKPRSAR